MRMEYARCRLHFSGSREEASLWVATPPPTHTLSHAPPMQPRQLQLLASRLVGRCAPASAHVSARSACGTLRNATRVRFEPSCGALLGPCLSTHACIRTLPSTCIASQAAWCSHAMPQGVPLMINRKASAKQRCMQHAHPHCKHPACPYTPQRNMLNRATEHGPSSEMQPQRRACTAACAFGPPASQLPWQQNSGGACWTRPDGQGWWQHHRGASIKACGATGASMCSR